MENKELRRQLKLVESRSASPFASASPQTIENAVAAAEVAELKAQVMEGQVSRPARCSQLHGVPAPPQHAAQSLVALIKGDDDLYTLLCCPMNALTNLCPALPPARLHNGPDCRPHGTALVQSNLKLMLHSSYLMP